ncbi:hypothetical protein, partial [uncultured Faecalibaculum sp.]|uniref:hypothetical protein n=1 Tax=uncultured Faecalibaculum sp. TaxID=1729681 RepID=UPI00272D5F4A
MQNSASSDYSDFSFGFFPLNPADPPLSACPRKKQQNIIPLQSLQPPHHFSQRLFFFFSGTGHVSSYLNV